MPNDPSSLLPAYRQIEHAIRLFIEKNQLKRHARLPTEAQLAEQHKVSVGTIRKAMNNLEAENVLYRRHGHGTFVAPRVRKGKVLLVSPEVHLRAANHSHCFDFFLGALFESIDADLPIEPAIVDYTDFVGNLEDLRMIHSDAVGAIFFRGAASFATMRPQLECQDFPCLYYGSNGHVDFPRDCPALYYDEYAIAELLAAHLAARGRLRVAGVESGAEICSIRSAIFAEVAPRYGIAYQKFSAELLESPGMLAGVVRDFDAVNSFVDPVGIRLIQQIERTMGCRVPDDIAVVGIDNIAAAQFIEPGLTTVDLCNSDNGRGAIRRFHDMLKGRVPRNLQTPSKIELIIRSSS